MKQVILIAEDSPTLRKFISFSLVAKGFETIPVSDGMEALERLPKEKVNLIITDLNMPRLDGFQLIKSVRENADLDDVPIIILSSLSGSEEIKKGISCGADSYLVKPFNSLTILYEVAKYLN